MILTGKDWHEGVIGIIASRIKDKYNKPTVIISINNDIGKASARSIVGFDIGSVIIAASQKKILLKDCQFICLSAWIFHLKKRMKNHFRLESFLTNYNFVGFGASP